MRENDTRLLTSKELGLAVSERLGQPKQQPETLNGGREDKQQTHLGRPLMPPYTQQSELDKSFNKWLAQHTVTTPPQDDEREKWKVEARKYSQPLTQEEWDKLFARLRSKWHNEYPPGLNVWVGGVLQKKIRPEDREMVETYKFWQTLSPDEAIILWESKQRLMQEQGSTVAEQFNDFVKMFKGEANVSLIELIRLWDILFG